MPLALIAEPDVQERTLTARLLRRIPGLSCVAVGSIAEALAAAGVESPSVLVVADELPDGRAADLLERLTGRGLRPRCVLVLSDRPADVQGLPDEPTIHTIERPPRAGLIRTLVQRSTRATLDRLPLFRPTDYIQLLCLGAHSGRIQCFVEKRPLGEIYIYKGEVWSAQDEEGDGEGALRRLLGQEEALAQTVPLGEPPPRTIEGRWEALLLEAAQLLDEQNRKARPFASEVLLDDDLGEGEATAEPTEVRSTIDGHVKSASSAVLRGELAEAASHFAAAARLDPDDRMLQHNVDRLRKLGYPEAGGGNA